MATPEYEDTVFLPAIPGLGSLYTQGIAGSLRLRRRASGLSEADARSSARSALGLSAPVSTMELPHVVYQAAGVSTADLAGQLRNYQELVHEAPSDYLPSGYLHVLAFPLAMAVMVRPDFPLPLLGMVHLSNDASLFMPVSLGDVLTVKAWAENLRPHPKGAQVDLVGEVWIEIPGSKPVLAWHGVSTYLAKGVKLPDGETHPSLAESSPDDVSKPQPTERGSLDPHVILHKDGTSEDTEPHKGEWVPPYPTGRWELGSSLGREYGAISGDRNPIHMSALTAKAFGFPRAIAHGMYTAARALAEVGPGRGATYRWTVDFAKPVLLPSKVDVSIRPMQADSAVPRTAETGSTGYAYQGWNSKKQIKHFTGTVTPL
jgi:acyl dehydratase